MCISTATIYRCMYATAPIDAAGDKPGTAKTGVFSLGALI